MSSSNAGALAAPQQVQQNPVSIFYGFSAFNETVTVLETVLITGASNPPSSLQQFAGARLLLLDATGNLHSVWREHEVLTGSCWDLLASLPALVPQGPLALLGLGAGTVPRISAKYFPGCMYHGWELDPTVVMAARIYLGMDQLEKEGALVCHIDDALTVASQGLELPVFSGVVVDLFAKGQLLPELTQASTWQSIRQLLSGSPAGARVLVNLGEAPPRTAGQRWTPEALTSMAALEAMREVWDGQVSVMHYQDSDIANNLMALTGPCPSPAEMQASLPEGLQHVGQQCPWTDGSELFALLAGEDKRRQLSQK
ncbi:MAG: hypothetical protein WDW38_001525 [Sanguina aurantia]